MFLGNKGDYHVRIIQGLCSLIPHSEALSKPREHIRSMYAPSLHESGMQAILKVASRELSVIADFGVQGYCT